MEKQLECSENTIVNPELPFGKISSHELVK